MFGGSLYQKLAEYGHSDYYAFHMPGHKRLLGEFENPYQIDITEIEGFDDLHHPESDGVLTQAQRRAAKVFGAEETHFLVNGSTAGILSAISGCTKPKGTILMARNCHRSAYHAAEIRELKTVYIYPQYIEELGINGQVLPENVENLLEKSTVSQCKSGEKKRNRKQTEIQAVMIVSPTYDGVCSDVRRIAEICHRYGVPLIVDQAHGAHFPFSDYFPEDAVRAGADVVIHSVHKTLPSMTQTALLHIQGRLVNRERICRFLSIYQSSSPSYVLMASIDACVDLLEREGEAFFEKHVKELQAFRESCRDLKWLYLAGLDREKDGVWQEQQMEKEFGETADFDRSKLLISARRANKAGAKITGEELSRILREAYHIQMEMSGSDYVVGIAGIADSEEGFHRLSKALHEIDQEIDHKIETGQITSQYSSKHLHTRENKSNLGEGIETNLPRLEAVLSISEAVETETELRILSDCKERLSAAYVYLYPPGIPILAPGERVTEELLERIEEWLKAGYDVHGLDMDSEGHELLKVAGQSKID